MPTWHLTHPSQAKTSASTNTQAPWEPVRLTDAHMEMIRQYVDGVSVAKIAINFKRFGVKYSGRQIYRVLNSYKGQEFASLYSAQRLGGIAGLVQHGTRYAPEAMYTEIELMRNPLIGERHRLAASQDVMDRIGPPKISRQETDNKQPTTVVINLTPSQMSSFLAPRPEIEAETVQLLPISSNNNDPTP